MTDWVQYCTSSTLNLTLNSCIVEEWLYFVLSIVGSINLLKKQLRKYPMLLLS